MTIANSTRMCYTYDELSRVTKRTIKNAYDVVLEEVNYSYDVAGNIANAPNSAFQYDTNNRLVVYNGKTVTYDLDGNMLSNVRMILKTDLSLQWVTLAKTIY